LLVVGVPRSGTTWTSEALRRAGGVHSLNEPDNWESDPVAHLGKLRLGEFPVLDPKADAPWYDLLWRHAFRGGWSSPQLGRVALTLARRGPVPWRIAVLSAALRWSASRPPTHPIVLVKSVHAVASLERVAARFQPEVIAVRSHPLNVISSWMALGWGCGPLDGAWVARHRPDLAAAAGEVTSEVGRLALAIGVLSITLDDAVSRHPAWRVVNHELLCGDPVTGFQRLFGELGLEWTEEAARFIRSSDGAGLGFAQRWRRLRPEEFAAARRVFASLPLAFPADPPGAEEIAGCA
jgi:hypothetical protein